MATIEDIQRKHAQFITSQDNIVDKIASYGVGITNDTPFQQYADKVEEAVSTKLAGLIDGITEFELTERDFAKIRPYRASNRFIRKYAFYRNTSLTKVVVPTFVNYSIEQYAFGSCTKLTEVILRGSLIIQAGAFNGCTALEKFYLPDVANGNSVPTLSNVSAFTDTTCQFVVPNEASKTMYIADSNWNTLADRFVVEGASV